MTGFTPPGGVLPDNIYCMELHPRIDRAHILKGAASVGVLGTGMRDAPRIMAEVCNPDVSAKAVSLLIRDEPTLYARILRVANSPYYGHSRSIASLERALVVLGLNAVRGIAAAACLDRALPKGNAGSIVDMQALMQHSLATAAAAESLAYIRHPALAPEAFIAGLLHNLGVVVQMQLDLPGVKAMVDLRRAHDMRDMRALETECAAVGHEECVAVVFDAWHLPESLIAATRHHHDPMAAAEAHRGLASLINLGALLGLAAGSTFALEPAAGPRHAAAMSWLGLNDDQLHTVARALPGRTAQLRSALLAA